MSDPAIFTPAKRTRSFEDVVEQIRNAVLEGRLSTGERLPNERELSQMFGISRSTLREGLRALEALGVVEVRPGSSGGVFAAEPQGDHVGRSLEMLMHFSGATARDLAEFRVSFEGETASWAARRATADDVAALEEIAATFERLAEDDSTPWVLLAETDVRFHDAVAYASHNQVRVAIMLGISRALFRVSTALEPLVGPAERRAFGRELKGIAAAVRSGDAALARSRMRRHVKRSSDMQLVQESGLGQARRAGKRRR